MNEWMADLGSMGPVLFVAAYVVAAVCLVPGTALSAVAGVVYGPWLGTALVSIGSTLGASAAFLAGRYLARSWVEKKLEAHPKLRALDGAVAESGWRIVLLTRLAPIFPYNLLNYAYGLTRVDFWPYLAASWAGMLPATVLFVSGTAAVTGRAGGQHFYLGLAATLVLVLYVTRMARSALAKALVLLLLASPAGWCANRLASESSPYLKMHAANPVDWYPWGQEALERARREQKPIFLSSGYSTCYWCHVMAKECFSDPEIARQMNEGFVNIKIDREERPDLDDVYMLATQLMTGSGGWPNSVFLTPELKPFFAGTYFPPKPSHGRPSFPDVLRHVREGWTAHRKEVLARAEQIHQAIVDARKPAAAAAMPGPEILGRVVSELAQRYDEEWGGFGAAPKFPSPSTLHALKEAGESRMLENTLERMIRGGIFDQLGGGFHRYSTDRQWLVPHFEKMLYDNAFLAPLLAASKRDDFRRAARRTLDFVLRELTGPKGEFHTALGAGEAGEEGAFYVWTREQIESVVGSGETTFLAPILGFEGKPNFEGKHYVLHLPKPVPAEDLERIEKLQERLLEARNQRPRPLLDTKVLTDQNGMMIRAMALASRDLGEPRYLQAAERSAMLLLEGAARPGKTMEHVPGVEAFLDDYAFLAGGLLALHEVTGRKSWLEEAKRVVAEADRRLFDEASGSYFFAAPSGELLTRAREMADLAIPSGGSWMARCLVDLYRATGKRGTGTVAPSSTNAARPRGERAYLDRAGRVLRAAAPSFASMPSALGDMAVALARWHEESKARSGPLSASATASVTSVARGGVLTVAVTLDIERSWHVNSAKPLQEFLLPTALKLAPGAPAAAGSVVYPPGSTQTLGFTTEPLSVYSGRVAMSVPLTVVSTAPLGHTTIGLELHAQACNDNVCLQPAVLRLTVPVEVRE